MTGGATAVAAASLAALACALALAPRPGRRGGGPARTVPAVAGAGAAGVLLLEPGRVVLLAVATGVVLAAWALVRRRGRRRAARRRSEQLLEACSVLASELTAGQPPDAALRRAASTWPGLAPVAHRHALGGDLPSAWRALAALPGAHDAAVVAAAWQVSARSGTGLGQALARVTTGLRATAATRRVVESELASARATARLLAALPLLALLAGSGAVPGASPWAFLTGTPVGVGCLVAGLALGFSGLWWIESIADDVERRC